MILNYGSLDKKELVAELITSKNLIDQKDFTITKLKSELDLLKRMMFGSKSERFVPTQDVNQASLELELEKLPEEATVKEKITYERKKSGVVSKPHPGRTPIPAHIERRTEVIEPKEDVNGLKKIGEEITEVLEYQAPQFYVRRIVRPKYARADKQGVITAQLPSLPIEKGMAGASVLAWIIIEKFVYHLPLHRLIQKFATQGIKVPAPTISDWVRQSCELLDLLYEKLKDEILKQSYLQADETPIPVLDKDKDASTGSAGQGATHQGYYWVYHSPQTKMVLFDYREGRAKSGPAQVLQNYTGFLQTDGYAAYETLGKQRITLFHCMAHARRYFEQALDNDKERSEYALTQIQKLYEVERICKDGNYTHEQRQNLRAEKSLPVLLEIKQWLKTNQMQVLPKSLIGKAINYSMERWDKLSLYSTNGRLEIDNNLIENQIRPVAIGRKNYLFAGSHQAAQRHAMIYSFIGTCKLRGIDPENWLREAIEKMPDYKVNKLHEFFD